MTLNITLPQLGKPKTVKDAIMSVLAAEWPLSVRTIYIKVRSLGMNVSYQAVHKAIKEFVEDGIVDNNGRKYCINSDWLRRIHDYTEKLLSSPQRNNPSAEVLMRSETANLTFGTPMNLGNFFVDVLECTSNGQGRVISGQWKYINSPIFFSKRYLDRLRKIMEKDKFYFVGREDSFVTRWLARSWESLGAKIRLGVNCASNCDILVVEDTIIQVFWPASLKKMFSMASYLKKIRSTDMAEVYRALTQEITEINVVVIRNPKVASQLREETLIYFRAGG